MVKNTVELNVEQLEIGMKISKDITKNGTVLVKSEVVINEELLERLKNILFLDKVQVYASEDIIQQSTKEAEIEKVEKTFQEVSSELKDLFIKMEIVKKNSVEELRKFAEKIQNQLKSNNLVISSVIFNGSKDDCIYRHGVNVAALSAMLGKWIGFEQSKINLLMYSALLHDFGMTKLSSKFQKRYDLVTDKNYREVREHTKIAYKYVDEIPYLDKSVAYGVLMHHERVDGTGYPFKLKDEKIHPFAKIIAIADELDVLNSNKDLKDSCGPFRALNEIKEKSLNELDYNYSMIFLNHILNFYIGEEVILSNGEKAKILQMNVNDIEKPLLLKDDEFIDLAKNKDIYVKELVIK
ncbi:MAG: HD domain-containing protein [Clostridium butyricum]|nr:HD domain-containing protein [Clostridium butyricum]